MFKIYARNDAGLLEETAAPESPTSSGAVSVDRQTVTVSVGDQFRRVGSNFDDISTPDPLQAAQSQIDHLANQAQAAYSRAEKLVRFNEHTGAREIPAHLQKEFDKEVTAARRYERTALEQRELSTAILAANPAVDPLKEAKFSAYLSERAAAGDPNARAVIKKRLGIA